MAISPQKRNFLLERSTDWLHPLFFHFMSSLLGCNIFLSFLLFHFLPFSPALILPAPFHFFPVTFRSDLFCFAAQMNTLEDAQEEYGWKLVHGDVFRPPSFSPMLLSVLCGTGMQVLAMTLSTITFAFLGFLSPANRCYAITIVRRLGTGR